MTYFYNPSDPSEDDCEQPADQVPTCDFIGGAIILSDWPVTVAVDGVKYYGDAGDQNIGQAFTYSATGNVYDWQAMPLVQKGNPANGMGATSGINLMNPNAGATLIDVDWLNPSGFAADNFGQTTIWVPGFATGFVYTMFQQNLPNGFFGSAIVSSDLPIAATSANVDYQVQYDGTVVWNLYNPCGFFRQTGDCIWEPPTEGPGDDVGQIIKTVLDDEGNPVAGVEITVTGVTDGGDDYASVLTTNAAGQASFVVPAGTYDVEITDWPTPTYGLGEGSDHEGDHGIVISSGENYAVTNTIYIQPGTKIIDTGLEGLYVCVFARDVDQDGKLVPIGEVEDCEPVLVDDKDNVGEVPDQGIVDAYYGYVYDDPNFDPQTVTCSAFRYQADAEAYVRDNGDTSGFLVDDNGNVCATLNDQYYSLPPRLETPEEMAERLGAIAVAVTDENGDATFVLPAGCYYAVVSGLGYESEVVEFCLEPGEVEINPVNLGEVGEDPGYLVKYFDYPNTLPIHGIDGVVYIINNETGALVFMGDALDLFGLVDPGVLEIQLAPGEYSLYYAFIIAYEQADGSVVIVPASGYDPAIVIESGETTVVWNILEALGVLDVEVYDAGGVTPLANIRVDLREYTTGTYLGSTCTNAAGEAQFWAVDGVDYTVSASDSVNNGCPTPGSGVYEDSADSTAIYSVDTDVLDGYLDDSTLVGTEDRLLLLDPVAVVPVP
jgi:hypothetical protein